MFGNLCMLYLLKSLKPSDLLSYRLISEICHFWFSVLQYLLNTYCLDRMSMTYCLDGRQEEYTCRTYECIMTNYISIPVWQCVSVRPATQSHLYPFTSSLHVAPFKQGDESHSSSSKERNFLWVIYFDTKGLVWMHTRTHNFCWWKSVPSSRFIMPSSRFIAYSFSHSTTLPCFFKGTISLIGKCLWSYKIHWIAE